MKRILAFRLVFKQLVIQTGKVCLSIVIQTSSTHIKKEKNGDNQIQLKVVAVQEKIRKEKKFLLWLRNPRSFKTFVHTLDGQKNVLTS